MRRRSMHYSSMHCMNIGAGTSDACACATGTFEEEHAAQVHASQKHVPLEYATEEHASREHEAGNLRLKNKTEVI